MPLVFIAFAILGLLVLILLTMPLSIVRRYRMGTARRPARGWVAAINLGALTCSSMLLLLVSALSNVWIRDALLYTVTGFAAGCLLGGIGLLAARWETTPRSLHYTPSRWLVLSITIVVAARIVYGFWRAWAAWRANDGAASWVVESGAAGSMGAGAVVLGYYVVFWAGVWLRVKRHRRLVASR